MQVRDLGFILDPETRKLKVVGPARKLIITTGDTSDVDGFLALAEYSKVQYDNFFWGNKENPSCALELKCMYEVL